MILSKITKYFIVLLVLTNIQTVTSQKNNALSNVDLAIQYFKAYSNWDYQKMKTFYSDSIHFKDPTAIEAFNANYDAVGKEKVMKIFKNIFPDKLPEHVNIKVNNHFQSGSYVIVNSVFELILPKSWYKEKALGKIFVSVPLVTILRFKKNEIISHKDYVDYDTYKKQISLQLKMIK